MRVPVIVASSPISTATSQSYPCPPNWWHTIHPSCGLEWYPVNSPQLWSWMVSSEHHSWSIWYTTFLQRWQTSTSRSGAQSCAGRTYSSLGKHAMKMHPSDSAGGKTFQVVGVIACLAFYHWLYGKIKDAMGSLVCVCPHLHRGWTWWCNHRWQEMVRKGKEYTQPVICDYLSHESTSPVDQIDQIIPEMGHFRFIPLYQKAWYWEILMEWCFHQELTWSMSPDHTCNRKCKLIFL